jgi:hypothetical protein
MVVKLRRLGQLGTPSRRLEDNIKMDLSKINCGDGTPMKAAQDRVRWQALLLATLNLRVLLAEN